MAKFDSKKDYYKVLGVLKNAGKEDIERAYRSEARKRHPDGGGSEEEMKSLNEARDILTDAETRKAYDEERRPYRPAYGSSRVNEPQADFDPEAAGRAGTLGIPVADEDLAGLYMSAATCFVVGLPLLALIEMQWMFFLWPLRLMAIGALVVGVFLSHSALKARQRKVKSGGPHPSYGLVALQEMIFWLAVLAFGSIVYLVLYARI